MSKLKDNMARAKAPGIAHIENIMRNVYHMRREAERCVFHGRPANLDNIIDTCNHMDTLLEDYLKDIKDDKS